MKRLIILTLLIISPTVNSAEDSDEKIIDILGIDLGSHYSDVKEFIPCREKPTQNLNQKEYEYDVRITCRKFSGEKSYLRVNFNEDLIVDHIYYENWFDYNSNSQVQKDVLKKYGAAQCKARDVNRFNETTDNYVWANDCKVSNNGDSVSVVSKCGHVLYATINDTRIVLNAFDKGQKCISNKNKHKSGLSF